MAEVIFIHNSRQWAKSAGMKIFCQIEIFRFSFLSLLEFCSIFLFSYLHTEAGDMARFISSVNRAQPKTP